MVPIVYLDAADQFEWLPEAFCETLAAIISDSNSISLSRMSSAGEITKQLIAVLDDGKILKLFVTRCVSGVYSKVDILVTTSLMNIVIFKLEIQQGIPIFKLGGGITIVESKSVNYDFELLMAHNICNEPVWISKYFDRRGVFSITTKDTVKLVYHGDINQDYIQCFSFDLKPGKQLLKICMSQLGTFFVG